MKAEGRLVEAKMFEWGEDRELEEAGSQGRQLKGMEHEESMSKPDSW